jgi:hypothetical protein
VKPDAVTRTPKIANMTAITNRRSMNLAYLGGDVADPTSVGSAAGSTWFS